MHRPLRERLHRPARILGLACALGTLAAGSAAVTDGAVAQRGASAQIAVVRTDGGISLIDDRGRTLRRLTGHAGWRDEDPSWSPDGTRIAFTRTTDGSRSIQVYVMRADGGGVRRLTGGRFDMHPAWSRDGRWIAYQSVDGIRRVRPDGRGAALVPGTREFAFPSWTPSGRLAFSVHPEIPADRPPSCRVPGSLCGWTVTARPDGRDRRALVRGRDAIWSPDGRAVVFTPPDGGVATIPASGGRSRMLGRGYLPDWSPDGRRIVFARMGTVAGDSVWVMDAGGGDRHRIKEGATSPAWRPSPEG